MPGPTSRIVSDDTWQQDLFARLTPEEKLVALYLDTNPHVGIGGLYQLSPRLAAYELGIPEADTLRLIRGLEDRQVLIVRKNERELYPRAIFDEADQYIFVPGLELRQKSGQFGGLPGHLHKTEKETRHYMNKAVIAFRDYYSDQLANPMRGKDGIAPCTLFQAMQYFRDYEFEGLRCPSPELNAKQWWEFNNDRKWRWGGKDGDAKKVDSWQGLAQNRILELMKHAERSAGYAQHQETSTVQY